MSVLNLDLIIVSRITQSQHRPIPSNKTIGCSNAFIRQDSSSDSSKVSEIDEDDQGDTVYDLPTQGLECLEVANRLHRKVTRTMDSNEVNTVLFIQKILYQ